MFIYKIKQYDDFQLLKQFIKQALISDNDISTLLNDTSQHRLIVIKPNWIQESHEHDPDLWECIITHPNIILAVIETVCEHVKENCTISICDAPHTYADFGKILDRGNFMARFGEIKKKWPDITFEILDLRRTLWVCKEGVVVERRENIEDPRGYVRVNLGKESLFYNHKGAGRYYGADYDSKVVNSHHCGETQEYLLAGTPMACDMFINIPKMKTHKKTGITCCLKNLVGINGDKNWLPHHTEGNPRNGGDEFPETGFINIVERIIKKIGMRASVSIPFLGNLAYRKIRKIGMAMRGDSERVIRNGNWYGNDTCWRMVLDLNRAFLYGTNDGKWRKTPRKYFAVVDGITGGQGHGPIAASPAQSGILLAGFNPVEIDIVTCAYMGFDTEKIPAIKYAFDYHPFSLASGNANTIKIVDSQTGKTVLFDDIKPALGKAFEPSAGWKPVIKEP